MELLLLHGGLADDVWNFTHRESTSPTTPVDGQSGRFRVCLENVN